MKEEFKQLLQQIESNSFTNHKLKIIGDSDDSNEEMGDDDRISDEGAILLSQALAKNSYIKIVKLVFQNIGSKGAIALAKVNSLEELYLGENNIKLEGAKALARTNLKILSLDTNAICINEEHELLPIESIQETIEAFIENKTILELDLSGNDIPDENVAQLINRNTTIKKLLIYSSCLTDKALKYIENNKTIEYLNLSNNNISDKGAEYISKNTNLQTLGISKSKITDKGADFLSNHPHLKALHMMDNNITIKGLEYILSNTHNKNNQLEKVVVQTDYNKIPRDMLFAFYRKFDEIKTIQAIESLQVANEDNPMDSINLAGNTDECENN